jgi:enoyl-CoA hydratase/carnithine racemase
MTSGLVELDREGDVFVLSLCAGENRMNTTLVRAIDSALDEVCRSSGAAALVTTSRDAKFFCNGLDLEWRSSSDPDHPGGDREAFVSEGMAFFARLLTLPIPTVCAVNGHAFGGGFMTALCHDVRVMRRDRGFLCANEVELDFPIPEFELALFRHKLSMPVFHQSVMLAKRWGGAEALEAGVVQYLAEADAVRSTAIEVAAGLAHLGANRQTLGWMKERVYGDNAAINGPHGPASMLRNPHLYAQGPGGA